MVDSVAKSFYFGTEAFYHGQLPSQYSQCFGVFVMNRAGIKLVDP
jgi:hypothetical protein